MKQKIMGFILLLLFTILLQGQGDHPVAKTAAPKHIITRRSIEKIHANKKLTPAEKVKQMVKAVLTAKIQVENHFSDFDFSVVENNPDNDNYSLLFFNKKVKLFREAKRYHNNYKIDLEIRYNFNCIQVSDDKASVVVDQIYRFQYVDEDLPSSIETMYEIDMVKKNTRWLLDSIRSNELFDQVYYKTDFNYNAMLKEMTTSNPPLTLEEKEQILENREILLKELVEFPILEYDRTAAVSYAYQYYSHYNTPAFPDLSESGGDCQNFASQCVSAGFHGKMQLEGNGSWYCIKDSQGFYLFDPGYRWTFSLHFNEYTRTSHTAQPGLYGYVPSNNSLLYTKLGDIIHGPGEAGEYQHAVIVTDVTGVDGRQTMDTIKVTGHSPNIVDAKLSDTFYYGAACKNCQIIGWVEGNTSPQLP